MRSVVGQDIGLDELRREYDRLCGLLTDAGPADPAVESAIVQDLQRLSDRIVALATTAAAPASGSNAVSGGPPAETTGAGQELERVLVLLERQGRQVDRILRRTEEHHESLARMESRLVEAMPLIEQQLPELQAATEQQRRRITALAVAVQRLIQWLAAQDGERR